MGGSFLFGGLLGFVPGVVKDDIYLGLFKVNTAHEIMHLVSGTIFIIAAALSPKAARLWFQAFGAFYGGLAAWGIMVGDAMVCGIISNNRLDAWGHAALALGMLLIGFAVAERPAARGTSLPQ
jgi:hypothetical protein